MFWSADEVEWYGYLLGSYRIATAPEPNKKGMRVFVAGKLGQRTWQDDSGNKRQSVDMEKEPGSKGRISQERWQLGIDSSQMKLHKLLALSLVASLAVMWVAPGSGALAQKGKKWRAQVQVVGTDADNDWGANVDPSLAPVGDELGQELVEAYLGMADAETVNFVIRLKTLPANDAGVPEFTRYGWNFSVDGKPMLISGGFTEVLRTFCYPLHSEPQCPPNLGDPQQSLERPFFVREGACTVGTGGVSDCRVKAVVSATFEHRSLHSGTGMITVPIPLKALGAKPGSKIEPATGVLGGTIYAAPAVIVASGNFPNDTMLVTKTFVVPGGKKSRKK